MPCLNIIMIVSFRNYKSMRTRFNAGLYLIAGHRLLHADLFLNLQASCSSGKKSNTKFHTKVMLLTLLSFHVILQIRR